MHCMSKLAKEIRVTESEIDQQVATGLTRQVTNNTGQFVAFSFRERGDTFCTKDQIIHLYNDTRLEYLPVYNVWKYLHEMSIMRQRPPPWP